MSMDSLQKREPAQIGRMFSRIAHRYDLMNTLMTVGLDQWWRREVVRQCALPTGGCVLDLGTGTGELARALARQAGRYQVWATDISLAMITQGQHKQGTHLIRFTQADAQQLPFPDASFDTVVSAFLMRNLPDHRLGLAEQVRVLKPGGRLVFLDIMAPHLTPLGLLYRLYFFRLVPWLGRLITGSGAAYRYLPVSTVTYPSPFTLLQLMRELGLVASAFDTYMSSTISLHMGTKPW